MENLKTCSLPELAAEISKTYKALDDEMHYVSCNCDDYCMCDGSYEVNRNHMYELSNLIDELVRRMES